MAKKTIDDDDGDAKALKRIKVCLNARETNKLDLRGLVLTALPPEIGQLTALKELYLAESRLSTLPPEIGKLKALTKLHVFNGPLTTVPPEIGKLTRLTELELLVNKLTVLPPEIGQLTALKGLSLIGNDLATLPREIGRLTALGEIKLTANKLTALPPEIGQLTALARLDLSSNKLTVLPPEIGQLTALKVLSLSSNELATLPREIGRLTALVEIKLTANKLTALPPEIGQLTALAHLDLGGNKLTTFPPEIGQLTALMSLDLGGNKLTTLPPEIGQLTALAWLDLGGNELTTLPPEIGQLTVLTQLNLGSNKLTTLPPEIGQLTALKVLDLSGNKLTMLPPEVRRLTSLTSIYLHDNPGLRLPEELLGPKRHKDYLTSMDQEIFKEKPPSEILDYYFAHLLAAQEGGTEPLMEAKILVLGEASVGKTCLIAALTAGEPRRNVDAKGTSGIVRKLWSVSVKNGTLVPDRMRGSETLRLNCWDFGGQEIYHSAHTLFLTHRAIYLIVISKRDNERQNNVDYWLRMATSFGGPEAVIYVVVNKEDEPVGHAPDEHALRRKYPQLRGFLRTSCDNLAGIPEARGTIVRAAMQLNGVRLPVAKSWLAIKKKLETMNAHTLSLEDWANLCGTKVSDDIARRELLHLCDRLGTVRYFPTTQPNSPDLSETAILNPEWVTLGIYALLDDTSLKERGGLLDRTEMTVILRSRGYPIRHERIIEEVMRRFDLLYDSSDYGPEHRMLIPLMLPALEPKIDWPEEGTLEFVYQYEVMPAGLIPAFTARQHKQLSKTVGPWRQGCVLELRSCKVRVIGDAEQKRVLISVSGPDAHRRDALDQVRFTFEALHGAVQNLPVQQLIPVPGHHTAPMLDYEFVRSLEWQGIVDFPTKGIEFGQTILVNVRQALDGVRGTARKKRDEEQRHASAVGPQKIVHVHPGAKYNEKEETGMTDDHSIHIRGDVYGQVGQTLTNCMNTIQMQAAGERRKWLEGLHEDVKKLITNLPEDKKEKASEIAENLEMLVKQATSEKPNRKWYSVSADGLLEASKYVNEFAGNIGGTIKNLGKAIWPDFQLPETK